MPTALPQTYERLEPYAPNDWNVHLGISPDPNPPVPVVDQWGGLRLENTENVPMEDAANFMRMAQYARQAQQESRNAAIRYQGSMEYQKMVDSGVPPEVALRKTAPKLFYNDEVAFRQMMREQSMGRQGGMAIMHIGNEVVGVDKGTGEATVLYRPETSDVPSVRPEISLIDDPVNGKKRAAMRTGPNTWRLLPADTSESKLQQKEAAIADAYHAAIQRGATEKLLKATTPEEQAQARKDILGAMTARSNLLSRAESPAAPPEEPWDKFAPSVLGPPSAQQPTIPSAPPPSERGEPPPREGEEETPSADTVSVPSVQAMPSPVTTNAAPVPPPELNVRPDVMSRRMFALTNQMPKTAAAPAQAPAEPAKPALQEGAIYRSKKTGKLYKVVNGEPVEQKGNLQPPTETVERTR